MDFIVSLASAKQNLQIWRSRCSHVTVASICKNFIHEFSFLEPSVKILPHENFPLYGTYTHVIEGIGTITNTHKA